MGFQPNWDVKIDHEMIGRVGSNDLIRSSLLLPVTYFFFTCYGGSLVRSPGIVGIRYYESQKQMEDGFWRSSKD